MKLIRIPNAEGIAAMTPRQHKSFETRLREAAKRRGLGWSRAAGVIPVPSTTAATGSSTASVTRTRAIPGRVTPFCGRIIVIYVT